MASIEIIQPGPLTTIQDAGRLGWRHLAIPRSGAMDPMAWALANQRAGSSTNHPALEIFMGGFSFICDTDLKIGFAGATTRLLINEKDLVQKHWPLQISAGNTITITPYSNKMIGYLSFDLRLQIPEFLASYATHVTAGLGGFAGRRLQKGDVIELEKKASKPVFDNIGHSSYSDTIRVFKGPEWDNMKMEKESVNFSDFKVLPESNRTGIRLRSSHSFQHDTSISSVPVAEGTVQLTPSGDLVVLMADGPTTGGYPRILQVVKEDLHHLAQKRPGESVRLTFVEIETEIKISNPVSSFLHSIYE